MLNKFVKRCSAVALAAAMVLPVAAVAGVAEEKNVEDKFTTELSLKIPKLTEGEKISVGIYVDIPDDVPFAIAEDKRYTYDFANPTDLSTAKQSFVTFDEYYKKHSQDKFSESELNKNWRAEYSPMAQNSDYLGPYDVTFEEYKQEHADDTYTKSDLYAKWIKRSGIYDKYDVKYEEYLYDYAQEHDISKCKPEFYYDGMQTAILVQVDKDELYRIAADEQVAAVDYWERYYAVPQVDVQFFYDAEDLLRILRASVDLERKFYSMSCDLDQDGEVTSSDALLALRSSVGLSAVRQPTPSIPYPLYDVKKYGK